MAPPQPLSPLPALKILMLHGTPLFPPPQNPHPPTRPPLTSPNRLHPIRPSLRPEIARPAKSPHPRPPHLLPLIQPPDSAPSRPGSGPTSPTNRYRRHAGRE